MKQNNFKLYKLKKKKGVLPRILFPLLSVMSRQISCACIICNIHNHQEIKGVSTYLPCSKKEKTMSVFFYWRETQAAGENALTSKPWITLNQSWWQRWCSLMAWQLWAVGAGAGVGGRGGWFPSRFPPLLCRAVSARCPIAVTCGPWTCNK